MDGEIREKLASLGIAGNGSGPSSVSNNSNDYTNESNLEQFWAIKAMKYAETHMKLLAARDAKELRLTKYDSEMYDYFMSNFEDVKVDIIDVEKIKSEASKSKWRDFCTRYEKQITDYNFATLIRTDSSKDYSEENTFIVPRVQFLAIEVVRNRQGLNSKFFKETPTSNN